MKNKPKEQFEYQYKKDYQEDWDIHRKYVSDNFDSWEAMFLGQVYDSVSKSIDGSKITDSYAMTLAKERADRVVAKLPEGQTLPIGKADLGKAAFMDIIRQKWIYPNANAQHPFLEKLNMWQLYSSVYGYMPMFYDWNVSTTGYVGPDCWLWNPRNLIPQQGRTSIADMDYVTALTWVSKKYLEDMLEQEGAGWNKEAIRALLENDEQASQDTERDTETERIRIAQGTKKGICLATRYEAGEDGEWITFAPDNGCIEVRRLKNPHKNGRIPFVIKYSQPTYDSFYGLGDFQRAKPLQYARDGLTNFYFKGIKMNLIPPIIVNANGVLKHTIDYREGSVMQETIPNSIRRLETSTAGLATYQGAQSNLTGSLLSQFGSQNASMPGAETLNPSQGKTPSAINMYSEKEATRDGSDRRHLQTAIEQLTDGFFSLIVNIGTESIPVELFSNDIEEIAKTHEDVRAMFEQSVVPGPSSGGANLVIKPDTLKGVEYRFNMKGDSTTKTNKDAQRESLENFIGVIGKFQNLFKEDPRIQVNWGAIMKAEQALSDIEGLQEFVTVADGPSPQEAAMMQENQQLQQQLQEMQAQLQQQQEAASQPATPVVTKSGHMFRDPELGQVADAVINM